MENRFCWFYSSGLCGGRLKTLVVLLVYLFVGHKNAPKLQSRVLYAIQLANEWE